MFQVHQKINPEGKGGSHDLSFTVLGASRRKLRGELRGAGIGLRPGVTHTAERS